MVPKKSRSCAVRVIRQNAATPTPRIALRPTSWPALLAASSGRLAPRCWLVTTAPPVASAPNSVMISWLIISTSDTPEIAASPTDDTITVSAMPTRISSICSMMSGQSSVSSWRLVNSLSFFIFTIHLTFPVSSIAQKKPPRNAGDNTKASPFRGGGRAERRSVGLWPSALPAAFFAAGSGQSPSGRSAASSPDRGAFLRELRPRRFFTHTAALRSGRAWRPCWRDNSRRTRRWPY